MPICARAYAFTQVAAGGTLKLKSGEDTNLIGATATGNKVVANVGGDLNIVSLQDTMTSDAKQETQGFSVSIPVTGAGMVSGSITNSKQHSSSNYISVGEQSGITAGAGGFDITVANTTNLVGGAIESTADADKNKLKTQELNTADLYNSMTASASSSGMSLSTDMLKGKYDAIKGLVGNAMNQGKAGDGDNSTTNSAISAGQITVGDKTLDTSKEALLDSSGKTVDETSEHRTVREANIAQLEANAAKKQADNMLLYNTVVAFTDPAYRAMFEAKTKMYKLARNPDGSVKYDEKNNPVFTELTDEERKNIKPGADGKIRVANNGIFNGTESDPSSAAKYAAENNNADYFIHFPAANNFVSELLVAAYQKHLEGNALGLTNATTYVKDLMKEYGVQGLQLDGHSRGSMTIGNALESLRQDGAPTGMLAGTTINFFGPAFNAEEADKMLADLQKRDDLTPQQKALMTIQIQNHTADPVGGLIGGNPGTGGNIPAGSNIVKEMWNMFFGEESVHNCYGVPQNRPDCRTYWENEPNKRAPTQPAR